MEKLKVGLIGVGKHSKSVWLPLLMQNEFFTFSAISSEHLNPDQLRQITCSNPTPVSTYTYPEDLILSPEVDCLIISNSVDDHGKLVIKALERNKPLLCEKPLCTDIVQISRIQDLYDKSKICVTGFMYRHHPQWLFIKNFFSNIKHEDWLLNATFQYSLKEGQNNNSGNQFRGGALKDGGCYLLDILEFIGAPIPTNYYKFSELSKLVETDLSSRILMNFPPHGKADLFCSVKQSQFQELKIFGENEHIIVESPFIVPKTKAARILHKDKFGKVKTYTFPPTDCYGLQLKSFRTSILNKTMETTLTNGVDNSRWLIEIINKTNQI